MGRPVVLKRPEEVINHKAEKTAEFVIPDLSLVKTSTPSISPRTVTSEVPPPVAHLQEKVME